MKFGLILLNYSTKYLQHKIKIKKSIGREMNLFFKFLKEKEIDVECARLVLEILKNSLICVQVCKSNI